MVSKRAIQRVVDEIGRKFGPQKIILFGSYARGDATEDSDVDLMIVMPHRGPGYEKATEISSAVLIDFPSEILVRSATEIRARLGMNDYFIRDVLEEGKVLFQRRRVRARLATIRHRAQPPALRQRTQRRRMRLGIK